MEGNAHRKHAKPPETGAPDNANCQVQSTGFRKIYYCKVPKSGPCEYRECYRDDAYCFHPDAEKIYHRSR